MSTLFTAEGEIGFRTVLQIRPIPGRSDHEDDTQEREPSKLPPMPISSRIIDAFSQQYGEEGIPGQMLLGMKAL